MSGEEAFNDDSEDAMLNRCALILSECANIECAHSYLVCALILTVCTDIECVLILSVRTNIDCVH